MRTESPGAEVVSVPILRISRKHEGVSGHARRTGKGSDHRGHHKERQRIADDEKLKIDKINDKIVARTNSPKESWT